MLCCVFLQGVCHLPQEAEVVGAEEQEGGAGRCQLNPGSSLTRAGPQVFKQPAGGSQFVGPQQLLLL